jgi:hypothetical protein
MSCASSWQITKLKQSIFAPFDIYGFTLATVVNIVKSLRVRFAFVWVGKNILGTLIVAVLSVIKLSAIMLALSANTSL